MSNLQFKAYHKKWIRSQWETRICVQRLWQTICRKSSPITPSWRSAWWQSASALKATSAAKDAAGFCATPRLVRRFSAILNIPWGSISHPNTLLGSTRSKSGSPAHPSRQLPIQERPGRQDRRFHQLLQRNHGQTIPLDISRHAPHRLTTRFDHERHHYFCSAVLASGETDSSILQPLVR